MDSGYISEGGVDTYLRGRNKAEDGYASEGGAEFYNKKIEQRMAYERQREDAEKAYLEMAGRSGKHKPLPQVLGRQGSVHGGDQGFGQVEQVYKVVGGRRNVEKADSGKIYFYFLESTILISLLNKFQKYLKTLLLLLISIASPSQTS